MIECYLQDSCTRAAIVDYFCDTWHAFKGTVHPKDLMQSISWETQLSGILEMPNWFEEMLSTHLTRGRDASAEVPAFYLAATERILALWVLHLQTAETDVQVNRKYKGRIQTQLSEPRFDAEQWFVHTKKKVKRLTGKWGGYGAWAVRENLEGSLLANDSNGQAEHPESEKKQNQAQNRQSYRSRVNQMKQKPVTRKTKTWSS